MIVIIILISIFTLIFNKNFTKTSSSAPYNNTLCATFDNLRYYNYSELLEYYDPRLVIPENYCYGILTYNITQDDFNNILALNLEAYKKYRSFLNLFYMYNNSATIISMSQSCLSYFRAISCYSIIQLRFIVLGLIHQPI